MCKRKTTYTFTCVGGVKLLGAPGLPHKFNETRGPQLAKVTKDLLDKRECARSVTRMVFDSTSLNTRGRTAGCVSIQSALDKGLLWLACRNQTDEVIIANVWDSLDIEVSKGPDIAIFIHKVQRKL